MIDCDAHILEPATLWEEYLEERYRDRAIRITEAGGKERLIIGNQVVLEGAVAGLGGAEADKTALFSGRLSYRRDNPDDSFDGHARLRRMDEWGITKAIIFPTICILPFPTDDLDLANAYCRAYNNWVYDFCQADRKRLFPVAVVNWRDVEEATREFERCIQRGFRGLFVPPEMIDGRRPADRALSARRSAAGMRASSSAMRALLEGWVDRKSGGRSPPTRLMLRQSVTLARGSKPAFAM
jgi:hypothetical protein